MERDEALTLLKEHLTQDNWVKHCLATEAIMRMLAEKFGESPQKWGLAGLLHDLDFAQTQNTPSRHGLVAAELLGERGVETEIIEAIRAHNAEGLGLERRTRFEYALACAETITGLIVATALVYPDKKLASVKPSSITKRMKKKDFARNVNREIIMECEKIGLSVNEFAELALRAMQGVSDELGL